MRRDRTARTAWCPLMICCLTACGGETVEATRTGDGPRDAGATIDTGTGAAADGGRRSPDRGVRFANFAYGTPAFDVCLRSDASEPYGMPLMRAAGRPSGLRYGEVSKYFVPQSDRFLFQLVDATEDCFRPTTVNGGTERGQGISAGSLATIELVTAWTDDGPVVNFSGEGDLSTFEGERILLTFDNVLPFGVDLAESHTDSPLAVVDAANLPSFSVWGGDLSLAAARVLEVQLAGTGKTALATSPTDMTEAGMWTLYAFGQEIDGSARILLCNDWEQDGPLSTCR
jgi:hypothetical protein